MCALENDLACRMNDGRFCEESISRSAGCMHVTRWQAFLRRHGGGPIHPVVKADRLTDGRHVPSGRIRLAPCTGPGPAPVISRRPVDCGKRVRGWVGATRARGSPETNELGELSASVDRTTLLSSVIMRGITFH